MDIAPDTWSVVVADVAGKGVSSALLASFLQGAFLSAAAGAAIGETLSRINGFMSERAEHGKYATIFYATLDAAGHLNYANAGHCAPLLVRHAGGEIESLAATSMPVGLLPEAAFVVEKRRLESGDRLVLYSDGVTEAQNQAGEFFGRRGCGKPLRPREPRIAPASTTPSSRRCGNLQAGRNSPTTLRWSSRSTAPLHQNESRALNWRSRGEFACDVILPKVEDEILVAGFENETSLKTLIESAWMVSFTRS